MDLKCDQSKEEEEDLSYEIKNSFLDSPNSKDLKTPPNYFVNELYKDE